MVIMYSSVLIFMLHDRVKLFFNTVNWRERDEGDYGLYWGRSRKRAEKEIKGSCCTMDTRLCRWEEEQRNQWDYWGPRKEEVGRRQAQHSPPQALVQEAMGGGVSGNQKERWSCFRQGDRKQFSLVLDVSPPPPYGTALPVFSCCCFGLFSPHGLIHSSAVYFLLWYQLCQLPESYSTFNIWKFKIFELPLCTRLSIM